ncbi:MAG TPA: hypothetical protein PKX48_07730 [Planctomycetota bacterium]|jgi:hypothetical protein|nr:hypothetical protein [Planctomycetota bacterium]NMD34503.1 hypothetical protein [Planctomycetota bacterium]HOE31544.1 hypothetical protein [Planctomycetota bacterium]HOE87009.1 hypothetical protein [Planctomycetota bacterium]HOR67588.1 hypothetical protein [Planctomycetota bacterium]
MRARESRCDRAASQRLRRPGDAQQLPVPWKLSISDERRKPVFTSFAYEELRGIRKAAQRRGLGRDFLRGLFYENGLPMAHRERGGALGLAGGRMASWRCRGTEEDPMMARSRCIVRAVAAVWLGFPPLGAAPTAVSGLPRVLLDTRGVSISIVDDKNANEKSYGLFFKRLCA